MVPLFFQINQLASIVVTMKNPMKSYCIRWTIGVHLQALAGLGKTLQQKKQRPTKSASPVVTWSIFLTIFQINQLAIHFPLITIQSHCPLVNVYITMENHHEFNGTINYQWAMASIAFCMFTRPGTSWYFWCWVRGTIQDMQICRAAPMSPMELPDSL